MSDRRPAGPVESPSVRFPSSLLGRALWTWGPAAAAMAAIFVVSGIENLAAPPGGVSDKAGHFTAYALLGALLLRAVARAEWDQVTWGRAAAAWAIAAAYALTDEVHQAFVPGRMPAADDWVADVVGAAVAILVLTVPAVRGRTDRGV